MNIFLKKYKKSKKLILITFSLVFLGIASVIVGFVTIITLFNATGYLIFAIGMTINAASIILIILVTFYSIKKQYVDTYVFYQIYIKKNIKATKRYKKSQIWAKKVKEWDEEISTKYNNDFESFIENTPFYNSKKNKLIKIIFNYKQSFLFWKICNIIKNTEIC